VIQAGAGNDTIDIGGGQLAFISQVSVNGGTGSNTLIVDDSQSTAGDTYTVSDNSVKRTGLFGGLTYNFGSIRNLYLLTETGPNTVNVLATSSATPVTIIGNGPSSVHVGLVGGVQSILGDLNIGNPPSFTTITVDDSTDSAAHTTTLGSFTPAGDTKWGYIRGLAPANINFEYADTNSPLTIETGGDGNVVNVLATGTTTNLVSHGQTTVTVGNSADGVQDIQGAFNIADPPSFTDVVVYDVADTVGRTATIDSGRITGLAPADITYAESDVSSLTVNGASGGNTFTINNTPSNGEFPLTTTLYSGSGADTVRVLATSGPLNINGVDGLDTVTIGDPVLGCRASLGPSA
jgi:hypothetical protein